MNSRRGVIVTAGTGALGQTVVGAFLAPGARLCAPWVEPIAAGTARLASDAASGVRGALVSV